MIRWWEEKGRLEEKEKIRRRGKKKRRRGEEGSYGSKWIRTGNQLKIGRRGESFLWLRALHVLHVIFVLSLFIPTHCTYLERTYRHRAFVLFCFFHLFSRFYAIFSFFRACILHLFRIYYFFVFSPKMFWRDEKIFFSRDEKI